MLYLFVALFFLMFYYLVGSSVIRLLKVTIQGFELIVGFLTVFAIFHVLAVFPTILHVNVTVIYYILFLVFIFLTIVLIKSRTYKRIPDINWFLVLIMLSFTLTYFIFDFIIPDDAAFYLPLIRSVGTIEELYTMNPWTGEIGDFIGYMYYFVTYEVYIGSIASLLGIDSTVFTVNSISAVNIIIILSSWYGFFRYLFKSRDKANKALLMYLFIFVFLNTHLHGIPFTHTAFNFMTNSFTGKALYFYAIVPFLFVLLNNYAIKQKTKTLVLIGILNLILPGLNASIIYLQLMMMLALLIYFLWFKIKTEYTFYGTYLLVSLTPIMVNYLFLIFAPKFEFNSLAFKLGVLTLFLLVILFAGWLMYSRKKMISHKHHVIKRVLVIALITVSLLTIMVLVLSRPSRTEMNIKGWLYAWPSFTEFMFLYGYDLIIFYTLGTLSFLFIRKQANRRIQFIFNHYLIIMAVLFINPITIPFVATFITSLKTYHRVFYILPVSFMIVYYLLHVGRKQLAIWTVLILIPGLSIFHDSEPLNEETHFAYKIDYEVLEVSKKFQDLDGRYRIVGDDRFIRELPSVTTNYHQVIPINKLRMMKYNMFQNAKLLDLYEMIHHNKVVDEPYFKSLVDDYQVEMIIVYHNNPINEFLSSTYKLDTKLSSKSIRIYRVN
ncbi:DUF6077 domain-containing protein [Haloplasma contractile]|uniref:Uncharacterized protein n=1 Tax=Haloplasma contractile SSD-17B TaxID=1033810 RepID=U2DRT5_9MOLU|nr:DUF6077 domain-containing protein [Haloplasma contractile]ERJ11282.1 hypothetical protein HLPCO_002722 [Haloplasma contractile SSD-17B]